MGPKELSGNLRDDSDADRTMRMGAEGFEPPKTLVSRFTVCPDWPLRHAPVYGQIVAIDHRLLAEPFAPPWGESLVVIGLTSKGTGGKFALA